MVLQKSFFCAWLCFLCSRRDHRFDTRFLVSVRWNIPNALDEVFYLFRRETSRSEYPGNPPAYLVCPPWRWTAEGRAGNTASSQAAEVPPTGSATA